MMKNLSGPREKGQALLVVLLSMAVILTVVLSIISRSITDISLTSYSEDALRAFSAAEAGVERALIVGTDVSEAIGDASFIANVSRLGEGSSFFNYPVEIYSGESVYIWFVSHNPTTGALTCSGQPCFTGNSAEFCWGQPGTPPDDSSPAIEVSYLIDMSQRGVLNGNFVDALIGRSVHDPNSGRQSINKFQLAQSSGCSMPDGTNYAFTSGSIPLTGIPCYQTPGCMLAVRVRSLYNPVSSPNPIGIKVGGGLLPAQGKLIKSQGTTSSQSSVRKIEAYRTFGGPAPIFDATVFSQGSVSK